MKTLNGLSFIDSVVKMPLMTLPVRTVVVQSKTGNIMISPGSQLTSEQLLTAGAITDLVAPNLFHSAGIPKALTTHPHARAWGVSQAAHRRPEIKWTHELTESTWPHQEELPAIAIDGMPAVNEVVFVHKPSRSLIVTDLCFNMTKAKGLGAWLILNAFGTYKKFGMSSLFLKGIKDRSAFVSSLTKVFSHDFDNIIVSHGELIYGGGKAALRDSLLRRGLALTSSGGTETDASQFPQPESHQ